VKLYGALFDFFSIFFMRWMSSGGRRFISNKLGLLKVEFGWIEIFGGQGVYQGLLVSFSSFKLLSFVGLGRLMLLFLFTVYFV